MFGFGIQWCTTPPGGNLEVWLTWWPGGFKVGFLTPWLALSVGYGLDKEGLVDESN
jgi:hypothetical protein